MKSNDYILCGSRSLIVRGLLHRKPKDLDLCLNRKTKAIKSFLKNINIDLLYPAFCDFDFIEHKGYKVKCMKVHQVLYFKYRFMKNIEKNTGTLYNKHYIDLANVFHNLGREQSINCIDDICKIKPKLINKEELLMIMEIGLNNKEEI